MKRTLKNVLLVGGLITVAAGLLAYFALNSMSVFSSVPEWARVGISALLGIAASVTLTSMGFSLDQDLLKKTDYKKMEKEMDYAGNKRYRKSNVPGEVSVN
jgi:hypothetical protein